MLDLAKNFLYPYESPTDDAKLWRYMDFVKYVSILSSKGLYFTSGTQFEDKFEGALATEESKHRWIAKQKEPWRKAKIEIFPNLSDDKREEILDLQIDALLKLYHATKASTYISCLHENEGESEAMWKLYAKDFDNALAIQTTAHRLQGSMGDRHDIHIGKVNYTMDYVNVFPDHSETFWYKRPSFVHEREVRAIYYGNDYNADTCEYDSKHGVIMPANLSLLIEKIYVSRSAGDWLVKLVKEVSQKYGLEVEVVKSAFALTPW